MEYHDKLKMAQKVQRRGPDKTLVHMHPFFFMVFHRLAFHDLSPLGDQPFIFHNGDETAYLMANGEMYNYREIIQKHDLRMRSDSDCEVIYHLYKKLGVPRLLEELDGEFAFVMVVTARGRVVEIVAARDPYGVRPLFYAETDEGIYFSSLAQGIPATVATMPFPPSCGMTYACGTRTWCPYATLSVSEVFVAPAHRVLTGLFIEAVRKRTTGERPLACLLSGGLDSSLVCGVMAGVLGFKDLDTFTIGMEGSTDMVFAKEVADFLGTRHHEVTFTAQEGLDIIDEVIRACETWDITTIRASVPQFLLARYISEKTEFRAVLNGDGADEAQMGYLYWYNAPSRLEAHLESLRRVKDIYLYDGLRVDRCLGWFGLEARLPFLDRAFVEYLLGTRIESRVPGKEGRMEKHLVREAFSKVYPDILPKSVLWRKKEAFSDGVSSREHSWFAILRKEMETRVSDEEFLDRDLGFPETPPTKEAYYYQKKFLEYFGKSRTTLIPEYWMPKWSDNTHEPSARVLSVYNDS